MRVSEADVRYSQEECAAARGLRRRTVIERSLLKFVPAALLGWLGAVQVVEAFRGGLLLTANPSWPIAVEMVREIIYGSFVFGAAVTLWIRRDARARDGRGRVIAASHGASFLLVGVGLLPTGPVVWAASNRVSEICLIVTVLGAALAVIALASLGSHFSIVPEAQLLVVTGPYRWLRHPMYFAELLMIVGIALSDLRITYLIGAVCVFWLQIYRISVEEQLLSTTFPAAYKEFVTHTRYRLVPRVW